MSHKKYFGSVNLLFLNLVAEMLSIPYSREVAPCVWWRSVISVGTLLVLMAFMLGRDAYAREDALLEAAPVSEQSTRGLLLDVVLAGERLIAVGERGFIVFSDDKGKSWTQATVPVRVALTAVHFSSPSRGWAVGHDGVVLASLDGGRSWTKQLDGYQVNKISLQAAEDWHEELLVSADKRFGEDVERGEDIAIENAEIYVEDSESFSDEGPTRPLLDVWFKNDLEGIVVGAYGLILRTVDGGKSWSSISPEMPNPELFHYNAIGASGSTVFIAGESGTAYRSFDSGKNWERLEVPYDGSFFDVVGEENGNVLLLGLRGNLLSSFDQGDSWRAVSTGVQSTLTGGAVSGDGDVLLIGDSGTCLLRSTETQAFEARPAGSRVPFSGVAPDGNGGWVLVGFGGVHPYSANHLAGNNPSEGMN